MGVDMTSGIAALQRGAGMGADVAMQHGNAMSRGYAGIGQALAGVGQAYKARQAKSKEEAALGSVATAAGIAEDDPVRGDPQTLVMAIKREWDNADQAKREQMQAAKMQAESSMKSQDRDHEIGMLGRQQEGALTLERERSALDIEEDAAKMAAENRRREEIGSFAMGPEQVETAKPNPYQFFGGADPATGAPGTRAVPDRMGRPPTPEESYRRALSKGMDPSEARSMAAGFQDLAPPKADRDPVQDALAKERALKAEGLGGYAPQPQAAVDPLKAKEAKARIAKLEAETARIQQGRPDPSFDDRIALVEKKMAAAKDTWDMEGIAAAEAEWRQILREKAGAGSPAAPAEDPIDAELRRRGAAPR